MYKELLIANHKVVAKTILAFLAIAFIHFADAQSQINIKQQSIDKIDHYFEQFSGSRPGYAVGIIDGGKLIFAKGFGQANLDYNIPIDASTVMNVASLSKQFTAAALALLILEDKVSLKAPVSNYIEEWPKRFEQIEVQHLVYMTSGLPEYYTLNRQNGRNWTSDYFTVEEAIKTVLASEELEFEPGSRWAYSNINYQIIAEIVARVSGIPFSSFVENEIFKPLGMQNSSINDDLGEIIPGRATGYNQIEGGYRQEIRRSPHYGGSGVFTTVNDLYLWNENFRQHELAGEEFTQLMLQVRKFNHDKTNDAFGLVWGNYKGHRTLWYEGGDLGFSSYMVRLPDEDLTVIVLSNLGSGHAAAHAHKVLDILF